jgi:hypothetical protein
LRKRICREKTKKLLLEEWSYLQHFVEEAAVFACVACRASLLYYVE